MSIISTPIRVMTVHSRSKNGVASLAYVTAIHVFPRAMQDMDARHKPVHDVVAGR
jgi:hypothetical protein